MKEQTYRKEEAFLSPFAKKSIDTAGRLKDEPPCPMRTDFQRDRDRILHSKSFRRLKNKTQVFFSPEGDHYRTRLTHTLDVAQVARSIARALDLNEDLAEAIALGHDLGHTPFGHAGERTLNALLPDGFEHNRQSLRVVDILEHDGEGLNLTFEVRDGILNHKKSGHPATLEGKAVSLADRIAYLNHDIDDAVRAGRLRAEDLPKRVTEVLGDSARDRINNMIFSIYRASAGRNAVEMEKETEEATDELRTFLFERVYLTDETAAEEKKADNMLRALFGYFGAHTDKLPPFYRTLLDEYPLHTVLADYLSSMSDKYAVYVFEGLFVPKSWTLQG